MLTYFGELSCVDLTLVTKLGERVVATFNRHIDCIRSDSFHYNNFGKVFLTLFKFHYFVYSSELNGYVADDTTALCSCFIWRFLLGFAQGDKSFQVHDRLKLEWALNYRESWNIKTGDTCFKWTTWINNLLISCLRETKMYKTIIFKFSIKKTGHFGGLTKRSTPARSRYSLNTFLANSYTSASYFNGPDLLKCS